MNLHEKLEQLKSEYEFVKESRIFIGDFIEYKLASLSIGIESLEEQYHAFVDETNNRLKKIESIVMPESENTCDANNSILRIDSL